MTKYIVGLLAIALVGSRLQSGHVRRSGTSNPSSTKAVLGPAEETFRLDMPNLSTSVKQGETRAVEIGIKRGKNFDEDVSLGFADVPKGVTIEPAAPVIKHGEKEAKISVKAADDAALGSFTIKVTGHPTKGADATNELKISVDKK